MKRSSSLPEVVVVTSNARGCGGGTTSTTKPSAQSQIDRVRMGEEKKRVVELAAASGAGSTSNHRDPYRMIKITEIIEINSDSANQLSFNESTTTTTTVMSEDINRTLPARFIDTRHEASWGAPKPSISDQRRESRVTHLPILVEKVSQTYSEDFESEERKEEASKPAEIVVEIINLGEPGSDLDKQQIGSLLEGLASSRIGAASRPKKITIRITGKTRSVSSNRGEESVRPAVKTCFSPVTPFKPPPSTLRNSTSLDVKNYDSFRPIQQRCCPRNDLDESDCLKAQLASEEDSTVTLSEAKFDLDKFKSYLSSFNVEPLITPQQRSTSMPPTTPKPTAHVADNKTNTINNPYRFVNDTNLNGFLVSRDSLSSNGSRRRTAFNSRKNLRFQDQSMKAASDTDEPVWAYRGSDNESSKSMNGSRRMQSKNNPMNSKKFGCGLFNKASRLSVKLEEDEEADAGDEGMSEGEKDLRENSEMSSRSLQTSKSPRYDHVLLSPNSTRSDSRSRLLSPSGQHQPRKKISSYYNEFYSNQNRLMAASLMSAGEMSDTSTARYIDDDATTITSNNEDDDDTEIDCDCNQIDEDEDDVDFDFRRRAGLSTFRPTTHLKSGLKTPKLVRKVIFADQI